VLGQDLLAVPGRRDRRRGLLAAFQRAADDGVERERGEPAGQRGRLRLAPVIERDAWRPPGQQLTGRRGEPMPDQENRRHALTLAGSAPFTPMSPDPRDRPAGPPGPAPPPAAPAAPPAGRPGR